MAPKFRRILIVDDDERVRSAFVRVLRNERTVYTAANAAEAFEIVRREAIDLVLVDLRLNGEHGLDVLKELKQLDPNLTVVIMSSFLTIWATEAALLSGAARVFDKGDGVREILAKLEGGPNSLQEIPTLARVDWDYTQRVLEECKGNVSEAARRLGLRRVTLQRKLKKGPPRR